MSLPNPIIYDPITKNLTLLEQDFRVDTVYHDEGVWCIRLKDPDKPLYITNGLRLIPALNFSKGRFLFLKYLRKGGIDPKVFRATLQDEVKIGDAMVIYQFLTNLCPDGIGQWLEDNNYNVDSMITVSELLSKAQSLPDYDEIINYFNKVDDYSKYEVWTSTIPHTEPKGDFSNVGELQL